MVASLTGVQIRTRVRNQFGDPDGVQITDAMFLDWLNDGIREVAKANNLEHTAATTAVVPADYEYAIPADILMLRHVRYAGVSLQKMSVQEADEWVVLGGPSVNRPVGTPTHYWIQGNQITLYPTPDSTTTGNLTIYYTKIPEPVADVALALTIPSQYHTAVMLYVLQQAYEMDDNWQAAAIKQDQYQRSIQESDSSYEHQNFYPSVTASPADYSHAPEW